ncbi:MAG: cytochrome c nitrite reductase small subunit [Campylobacteraceae bacterium]|nr:cytochrome c nitrite reductase small subunit [Campylobacteraceae bacterium]
MKTRKLLVTCSVFAFVVALGLLIYTLSIAKAASYLTSDSMACINCHVMNTQYATWQHSSHASVAACADCHLPHDGVQKYIAKARDGLNHAVAFTFNTYKNAIVISDNGAKRVQENCISCHATLSSTIVANSDINHRYDDLTIDTGRRCWECHKEVPHGKVRGLSTTPDNLGVKYVK